MRASACRLETVRTFWHGSPLGPYQLVGLRSFVDLGHRVELFTYDPGIDVPEWLVRRDANEIWPADYIMRYQRNLGRGSFALHSNLFRYAMLHKLGGWWIDADIILLRPDLPDVEIFFALECETPLRVTFSVLKFPSGHPALAEAVNRCVAVGENVLYGETGPDLLTELVAKYDIAQFGQPMDAAYPLSALDVPALFDPEQCSALKRRCANSCFVHLFNETWRRAGIPQYLGPPRGSFIEDLLQSHTIAVPEPRMEVADVKRWTAYLTLHEEFQAGLHAYRQSNEALRARLAALEQNTDQDNDTGSRYQSSPGTAEEPYQKSIRELEYRMKLLNARVDMLARAYSQARRASRRIWLRPPIWTFEQHAPKLLDVNPKYRNESVTADAISVAIVTPSFNHGNFIKATIDSVLSQNYPRLSYFVQDGGSTDDTIQVLKSYGPRLMWRSERDSGQTQAINRGFANCSGDIMAYLNSDDLLLPGALAYAARVFQTRRDVDVIYSHRIFIDRDGQEIGRALLPRHDPKALYWADYLPQETMFWRRRVWETVGLFDESFQYALDWDFILRAQQAGFRFLRVPRFLACFRVHDAQKTAASYDIGREEMKRLRTRYIGYEPSHRQVIRKMLPYLIRQFVMHWLYRFRILHY